MLTPYSVIEEYGKELDRLLIDRNIVMGMNSKELTFLIICVLLEKKIDNLEQLVLNILDL